MHHLRTLLLALLITISIHIGTTPPNKPKPKPKQQDLIYGSLLHPTSSYQNQDNTAVTCTPTFSNGQTVCVAILARHDLEIVDGSPGLVYVVYSYYVQAAWLKEWVLLAVRWGIVLDLVGGLQFQG
ncbi:hypothetical protein BKA64DRAFT_646279 [Cadophora sp. MPI-SDFR-AT-0126]|nr:hypothetical protein BKA64DRAFT_646279 [Leotiomycetes sp. MPI-SDFR-AT-0126]